MDLDLNDIVDSASTEAGKEDKEQKDEIVPLAGKILNAVKKLAERGDKDGLTAVLALAQTRVSRVVPAPPPLPADTTTTTAGTTGSASTTGTTTTTTTTTPATTPAKPSRARALWSSLGSKPKTP